MSSELKITSVEQAVVLYVLPEKLCIYEHSNLVNEIDLVHKEAVLLGVFFQEQFKLVERKTLFEICWPGRVVSETSLNVAMMKLRKKLSEAGVELEIKTVPGQGYKLVSESTLILDVESESAFLQSQKKNSEVPDEGGVSKEPREQTVDKLSQDHKNRADFDSDVVICDKHTNKGDNGNHYTNDSTQDSLSVTSNELLNGDSPADDENIDKRISNEITKNKPLFGKVRTLNRKRKVIALYASTAIFFVFLYGGPFFW